MKRFLACFFLAAQLQAAYVLIEGDAVKTVVPSAPLVKGSIQVHSTSNNQRLKDWTNQEHRETFSHLKKIAHVWEQKGVANDYLVYGKNNLHNRAERFNWEIVPYSEKGSRYLQQLYVLWRVNFGGKKLTDQQQEKHFNQYTDLFASEIKTPHTSSSEKSDDAFCRDDVIDRQWVYRGKKMLVLYDQAPLRVGDEKPEFLILPKAHKERFTDLTEEEYVEAMQLAQMLSNHFRAQNVPASLHLYHKTGSVAGQTIPHWHLHAVVIDEVGDDPHIQAEGICVTERQNQLLQPFRQVSQKSKTLFNRCRDFCYLLVPPPKLSDDELAKHVAYYRANLK